MNPATETRKKNPNRKKKNYNEREDPTHCTGEQGQWELGVDDEEQGPYKKKNWKTRNEELEIKISRSCRREQRQLHLLLSEHAHESAQHLHMP
jgi:hypothetical protein